MTEKEQLQARAALQVACQRIVKLEDIRFHLDNARGQLHSLEPVSLSDNFYYYYAALYLQLEMAIRSVADAMGNVVARVVPDEDDDIPY